MGVELIPKALGVIVGRGGSKRLPKKALRELGNHPLIAWAIRAATASSLNKVIVSTDDPEVATAAELYGASVPFLRPAELAQDNVGNAAVLGHALEWMVNREKQNFEIIVLIQPSSPFVRPEDIDSCISGVLEPRISSCFTVAESLIAPEAMFRREPDGTVTPIAAGPWLSSNWRNHPIPPAYHANGAVWAVLSDVFLKTGETYSPPYRAVEMSRARSIDINFEYDLLVAQAMLEVNGFQITNREVGPLIHDADSMVE